eukprot:scaffold117483_cov46-Phaeocystis_antarctica.AAC.2
MNAGFSELSGVFIPGACGEWVGGRPPGGGCVGERSSSAWLEPPETAFDELLLLRLLVARQPKLGGSTTLYSRIRCTSPRLGRPARWLCKSSSPSPIGRPTRQAAPKSSLQPAATHVRAPHLEPPPSSFLSRASVPLFALSE